MLLSGRNGTFITIPLSDWLGPPQTRCEFKSEAEPLTVTSQPLFPSGQLREAGPPRVWPIAPAHFPWHRCHCAQVLWLSVGDLHLTITSGSWHPGDTWCFCKCGDGFWRLLSSLCFCVGIQEDPQISLTSMPPSQNQLE